MKQEKRTVIKTQTHVYLSPYHLLQPYVAHYTLLLPNVATDSYLAIIPDASGCIVFALSEEGLVDAHIWGPTTKTQFVTGEQSEDDKSPIRLVFIEFRPCGLSGLTGFSAEQIKDCIIPLSDILPQWKEKFERLFATATSWDRLFDGFDVILLQDQPQNDTWKLSNGILRTVREQGGTISVQTLSDEFTYSSRHLNRILSHSLGMSAKAYIRLLRVNLAVTQLQTTSQSFTQLSQQLGYYDQAHFIHDFKEICGVTPSEYQKQMSDFYNELYKF